jgi:hypothetical protein
VTYKDDLEEHLLVNLHVLLVPLLNVGGLLARIGVVISGGDWVVLVVLAPFHDLLEDRLVDLVGRISIWQSVSERGRARLTLGTGMGSVVASAGRSSSKFLMRMERMATWRSANC